MALLNILTGILMLSFLSVAPGKAKSTFPSNDLEHKEIETEDYLPWSHDRMLTWDDFLCQPVHNSDAVALASTTLGISYKYTGGRFSYNISCSFSKKKSWGVLKTPYILAHEQAHFDISEVFARKLHEEMRNYRPNFSSVKKDVSAIYSKVIQQEKAFQEMYDKETNHSRRKVKQQEWLERVAQLLEETEAYANYP